MGVPANDNIGENARPLHLPEGRGREFARQMKQVTDTLRGQLRDIQSAFEGFNESLDDARLKAEAVARRQTEITRAINSLPDGPERLAAAEALRRKYFPQADDGAGSRPRR